MSVTDGIDTKSSRIMNCLTPQQILTAALGQTGPSSGSSHIDTCSDCRKRIAEVRALAAILHSASSSSVTSDCLDDAAVAAMVDGKYSATALAHAATCGYCSERIASVARLLDDPSVEKEISSVEKVGHIASTRWSGVSAKFVAGLAVAAAATIVLLGPIRSRVQLQTGEPVTRENVSTELAAPHSLHVTDALAPGATLHWSAVPQADLYRIRIWNTEGSVVWTAETHETSLALPDSIKPGVQYVWEVKARTGWDRWVSSELYPLMVRSR